MNLELKARVQYLLWRIETDNNVKKNLEESIIKNQKELDSIYSNKK